MRIEDSHNFKPSHPYIITYEISVDFISRFKAQLICRNTRNHNFHLIFRKRKVCHLSLFEIALNKIRSSFSAQSFKIDTFKVTLSFKDCRNSRLQRIIGDKGECRQFFFKRRSNAYHIIVILISRCHIKRYVAIEAHNLIANFLLKSQHNSNGCQHDRHRQRHSRNRHSDCRGFLFSARRKRKAASYKQRIIHMVQN